MDDLNFRSTRDEFVEIENRWMALSSREALLSKREQEVRKREAEVRRMMSTGKSRPMQTMQTPMPMRPPIPMPMPMPTSMPPPMRLHKQQRPPSSKYNRTKGKGFLEHKALSMDKDYSQFAVYPKKPLRGEPVMCSKADCGEESESL